MIRSMQTHHVLPPLHEFLVDHLACVVFSGLDVYGLLDDGIRATPKRLAGAILFANKAVRKASTDSTRVRDEGGISCAGASCEDERWLTDLARDRRLAAHLLLILPDKTAALAAHRGRVVVPRAGGGQRLRLSLSSDRRDGLSSCTFAVGSYGVDLYRRIWYVDIDLIGPACRVPFLVLVLCLEYLLGRLVGARAVVSLVLAVMEVDAVVVAHGVLGSGQCRRESRCPSYKWHALGRRGSL